MTKQIFFNPDLELTGFEEQYIQNKKNSFLSHDVTNPTYTCPYDGTYCQQKEARIIAWRDSVTYHAIKQAKTPINACADMFKKCPLDNRIKCIRRLRYEKIIEKMKQNTK